MKILIIQSHCKNLRIFLKIYLKFRVNVGLDKFKMKNITVQERLGGGNYGEVFRGLWKVIFNLKFYLKFY